MASYCGKISIKSFDLNLKHMLEGGQSFRWRRVGEGSEWIGVFDSIVWKLTQSDDHVAFAAHTTSQDDTNELLEKRLSNYLRLDAPLDEYYHLWSEKDANFKKAAQKFHGIRILNQDPVENVFSFICSSNNNIARISQMVEKLCELYGEKICCIDDRVYYSFPCVDALTSPSVENTLRQSGFGYRAKFIRATAQQLSVLGGSEFLESLMQLPYIEARQKLLQFQGIGPKVGDCICLMSLGHFEAVPVDTHVFQVACESYLPHLKKVKSVTDKVYREIGDFFRELYGPLAGWAHTILFCADLKKFKTPGAPPELHLSKQKKAKKRKARFEVVDEVKKKSQDKSHAVAPSGTINVDKPSSDMPIEIKGKLKVPCRDLYLRVTLNCGQTYRWKEIGDNVWRGVFSDRVWTLQQFDDSIDFTCHYVTKSLSDLNDQNEVCMALLKDYFRLDEDLGMLYEDWARRDHHFTQVSKAIYGLRMTRQDPVENLFAFICSSNTTILRITRMVEHLCLTYGDQLCTIDDVNYQTPPRLERLCVDGVSQDLRSAGFGFRAHYVEKSARFIQSQGAQDWFDNLVSLDYTQAKHLLMQLPGVGAKVADCICLTALDHLDTIPVDTHVFQIAKKYYLHHLKNQKHLNRKSYQEIGDHFRQLFGHHAGWAHTVLFCSELETSAALLASCM